MVTAGEVLRTKRESLGRTLNQISQETKIQEKFLEYIENNEFEKFDSDVFVSGFIKIYSDNLGLDTDRVLALYRRSNGHIYESRKQKQEKISSKKKFVFSPAKIAITLVVFFLITALVYIGYEIYIFQNPPSIEITSPKNGYVSTEDTITIEGETKNSTYITLSGEKITINSDGSFSLEYTLKEGENKISLTAVKESTKQKDTSSLDITYRPEAEENNTDENTAVTEYKLKLVISNENTWIKLDIDGESKISQTLEPGEFEYIVEDRFEIISGRPLNTSLYINEEEYTLKQDMSSGAYSLSCEVLKTGLVCE
jgi:cytoskeletal protein RodZ